tara:strand:+ start:1880 stop:3007 length:1128 start_codon:yes stop_codon:yes gene_type:complete
MATTTVTAKDTSRAMEDIIDRLGEDAVILSTSQKNGKVEMTATNDSSSIPPKRLKPSQQFSKIFESRMLNEQVATNVNTSTLELTQAVGQSDGASSSQLSAVRSELKEIKKMLSGVVVTEPQNLNDKVASSTALKLRQAGFSSEIVNILDKSILNKDYENARVAFLRSLAKRLVPDDTQNLNQSKVIYVIGSSGSGRTTLSAKIAAYFAERSDSKNINEVCLAELDKGEGVISEDLRSYGRLLNINTSLVKSNQTPSMNESNKKMIIDVSLDIEDAYENITNSRKLYGKNKIAVILSLPGGSSNKLINALWSSAKDLNPTIALTKLDECEMGPEEFSNLAEKNSKITIITGTDGIVGTVAVASENVLTQYLKENC